MSRKRLGAARVWLFTMILATACVALFVAPVIGLSEPTAPVSVPWWLLAAAFCFAEIQVVHVHFGSNAHSFSLSEPPLIIGLFFVAPHDLVVAQVVGAAVALAFHRRQSLVKLVFNVANLGLQTEVAVLIFNIIGGHHDPTQPSAWALGFLAVLAGSSLTVATVHAAISLSEGRVNLGRLPQMVVLTNLASTANASMGLLIAAILWTSPGMLALLIAPVTVLFTAYRAYVRARQENERIQFLYESSRLLGHASQRESDELALLAHARSMFRAELIELIALPLLDGEVPMRTTLGPQDRVEAMEPVDESTARAVADLIEDQPVGLLLTPTNEPGAELLSARGLKDAMVVALRGDSGMVGTILVGNRLGDVTTFDQGDLTLLETLASQVGAALENTRLERRLQRQAFHDSLTSLANRALFHDRVRHALARRESSARSIAVLLLDIDDFKLVNDSQGHTAGDDLLIGVGQRVLACVRPFDTVARLGGDEFAVLLEDANAKDAMGASRRILASLQSPFDLHGHSVTVHASIGIAVSGPNDTSVDKLLAHADMAMYHAKSRGKGRFELFDPALQAAVVERHTLQAELERAADEGRVVVEYQPIVDLRTGSVAGVEALVRWRHPTRGLLSPADFVPLAEETGLIVPIGRVVLEHACRQAARWESRSGEAGPLSMSVNVSVRQFQQGDFVEDVTRTLRTTRLSPSKLTLELTESIMVEGSPAVVEKLHQLKALGVQLAIDDFGTGYSSLSALRALPIDMLKIAKPFVEGVGVDAEQEAFAHAILRLGSTLDLRMVAEGIETQRQAEWLRHLGCELGQGYYFAKPLSASELEAVLDAQGVVEQAGVLMSGPTKKHLRISA